ncbi:MAG: hypothetical protein JWQ16_197 [Novosphingobium sp.]|nr:hypothetical protein [Novosphingobium sp.]
MQKFHLDGPRRRSLATWVLAACVLVGGLVIGLGGSSAAAAAPDQPLEAIIVFGNDACPQGTDGEIVVCARQPESERYRIPKSLRQRKADPIMERSWTSRIATADAASQAILPNSCSPIGSYGQSGCTMQMLQQWAAERRAQKAGN